MNDLFKVFPKGARFGELFMCLENLSRWRNLTARKGSVFQHLFLVWIQPGYGPQMRSDERTERIAKIKIKAVEYAAAVFTPEERPWLMSECKKAMSNMNIYTASLE